MYRLLITILIFVLLLSGCMSNNEGSLNEVEEKHAIIAELQMDLEQITKEYEDILNAKDTQLINLQEEIDYAEKLFEEYESQSFSKITNLEQSIVELEDELSLVRRRLETRSGYNMITGYHDGKISMGYNPDYISLYSNLMIVGYGEFELDKHEVIDLSDDNTATLKVDIAGELYNFRLGYIEWDSEYKNFTMSELVYSIDAISNTTLLFDSVLAEGIPGEAILWTDKTGKEFSYLIGDNSLRGDTFPYIIISELLE
jgi:uncharacterized protein YcfL